jgi:hypothetical protein
MAAGTVTAHHDGSYEGDGMALSVFEAIIGLPGQTTEAYPITAQFATAFAAAIVGYLEVVANVTVHGSTHAPGSSDAIATGSTSTTVCIGNDSRLSDSRMPISHGSTHAPGSADAIATGTGSTTVCIGNDARLSNSRTPTAHASTHAPGSDDAVATGTTSTTLCIGNDARLSDSRIPTAHASTHAPGSADAVATGSTSTTVCIGNDTRLEDARTPAVSGTIHRPITCDGSGGVSTTDSTVEFPPNATATIRMAPSTNATAWDLFVYASTGWAAGGAGGNFYISGGPAAAGAYTGGGVAIYGGTSQSGNGGTVSMRGGVSSLGEAYNGAADLFSGNTRVLHGTASGLTIDLAATCTSTIAASNITATPTAYCTPKAGSDNKIAAGWIDLPGLKVAPFDVVPYYYDGRTGEILMNLGDGHIGSRIATGMSLRTPEHTIAYFTWSSGGSLSLGGYGTVKAAQDLILCSGHTAMGESPGYPIRLIVYGPTSGSGDVASPGVSIDLGEGNGSYVGKCGPLSFSSNGDPLFQVFGGWGSPEASIAAPRGSLYLRTDAASAPALYVKDSGSGNTGWKSKDLNFSSSFTATYNPTTEVLDVGLSSALAASRVLVGSTQTTFAGPYEPSGVYSDVAYVDVPSCLTDDVFIVDIKWHTVSDDYATEYLEIVFTSDSDAVEDETMLHVETYSEIHAGFCRHTVVNAGTQRVTIKAKAAGSTTLTNGSVRIQHFREMVP